MKTYLSFLILFVGISLFAQTENPTTTLTQQYDHPSESWLNWTQTVSELDNQGRVISETTNEYVKGEWQLAEKNVYGYDDDGLLVHSETQIYVEGQWINKNQYMMTKNAEGKKGNQMWQTWEDNQWVNERQLTHHYDGEFMDYQEHQSWNNNNWENTLKETYTRDNEGHEMERQVWMWVESGYNLSTRTVSEYSPGWTLSREQIDISSGGAWEPFQELIWTVTPEELVTNYQESFWDNNAGGYVPSTRATYVFDVLSRIEQTFWEDFNTSANSGNLAKTEGSWTPTWRLLFEYSEATGINRETGLIIDFHLADNYPNPFNPTTTISYSLPTSSKVELTIHSITGEIVATLVRETLSAGAYTKVFDATKLSSGMYFYKLQTEGFVEVKKMMMLK